MNPLVFCSVTETCEAMFGSDIAVFVAIILAVVLLGMLVAYVADFLKTRNKRKKMHH